MKAVEFIADILKAEGAEYLFGYPVNPLFEAAAERGIRPIIVRQERTAVHMADALARVSSGRQLAVFAAQHGPGAENSFGAVAQAFAESVPILVIPGGYGPATMNRGPYFSSFLNYRNITKSNEQLTRAADTAAVMRRAISHLRNGRPRPALIEVPWDVFYEDVPAGAAYESPAVATIAPSEADVERVAEQLLAADSLVIYAGQGIHYARAWTELRELAELLECPVTTSLEGKSSFPEDHRLSLGSGGRAVPAPVTDFLRRADVVFGIGCSFAPTDYGIQFPVGPRYIQATIDPADLNQDIALSSALVGDAREVCAALVRVLRERIPVGGRDRAASVASQIATSREPWLSRWRPKLESDQVPITPYRAIAELLASVDIANTIITHDAGSPRDQLSPFWPSTSPLTYLGWGKTTQLGYGLGLAMGAKLAEPEKLCVNLMGDAAIGFTGTDLETAVREHIPTLTVVFNNHSMAVELPVMPISTERYRSTDISGDYTAFARALGCHAERVERPEELKAAIARAIASTLDGTPAVLEVMTAQELEVSLPE